MNLTQSLLPRWISMLLMILVMTSCSDTPAELALNQPAITIENGEECHLCGMAINRFAGPKGQAYKQGDPYSRKFCSTRDMFAYMLDPEHHHAIQTAYVHDMAAMPWDNLDDSFFIDAVKAWYVVGHSLKGAMGPTLASFSNQQNAEYFASEFGGKIYPYSDITMQLLR